MLVNTHLVWGSAMSNHMPQKPEDWHYPQHYL